MHTPSKLIEKAAAQTLAASTYREYLTHAYLDVERQRLIATNGQIMAIVPVICEDSDTSGYVTLDALVLARKAKANIAANGSLALSDGRVLPRPDADTVGKYPDIDRVLPAAPIGQADIYLDANLLYRLAQAISRKAEKHDGLRIGLTFAKNSDGTIDHTRGVRVDGYDDACGVIMPMRE